MEKEKQKDKFNPNQRVAVFTQDKDILVSAGAGCGKTFVMIERIAENIISKKVSVDELLVVTYTNAAASEMRVKLNTKINELLSDPNITEEDKKYLQTQSDLIGQSDICTLHKFCINIIQKYFYVLDIDPSSAICEDSQAKILRNRAYQEVIDQALEENDAGFKLLASTFDDKRGFEKIGEYVFKIYDFLNNQPSIDAFRAKVNSAYNVDLNNNRFAQIINKSTVEFFDHYIQVFSALKQEAMLSGLDRLVELLDGYITILNGINSRNDFYQNHRLVYAISLKALPRNSVSPEDDALKTRISEVKAEFSKGLKTIKDNYITSDIEELKNDLMASQGIVNAMFDLVQKFGERYLTLKKEKNLLDFSDLEHFAYKILSNPKVGEEIRNKYKQIYVDEYQDVNDIQEGILNLIHKERDIFLVGDVKQSIYGFRNTNPQIFLDKLTNFGLPQNDNAITIPLNENYRSDQRILDYVNYCFSILMTKDFAGIDYVPDNEMHSGAGYVAVPEGKPIVEIMVINKTKEESEKLEPKGVYRVSTAPNKEDIELSYTKTEAHAIYNKIIELMSEQKQIYDAKKKIFRPIQFGDITILSRTRSKGLIEILNELSALGLPVTPVSTESILKEYEVRLLFDYLTLVNNRQNDVSLAAFLVSPIVGIDEDELANIRLNNPKCEYFWECVLCYKEQDNIKEKIDYALELIEDGRSALINGSIYDMLIQFCKKTNYIHLISAVSNTQTRKSNIWGYINSFLDKKDMSLSRYLSNLSENKGEQDVSKEANMEASAIGFATMHQSKGLEYPIVFMVDCGHNYNTQDKRGDFLLSSELGIGMYTYDSTLRSKKKTILHSAVRVATKDKDLAERERLLYVAMTRAKNHLYITGAINLEKFNSYTTAYALKGVQNDLSLILSSVAQSDIETLKSVGTFTKEIAPNNVMKIHSLSVMHTEKQEQVFGKVPTKVDEILAQKLRENIEYEYPYQKDTIVNQKNTVTALNRLNDYFEGDDESGKVVIKKKESVDTTVGIAFHKAMQLIDFNLDSLQEIEDFLSKNLTNDEFKMVDCGKILRAVQNLRPFVMGAEIKREQPFVMKTPLKELIDTEVEEEVVVEGVIDLLVKRGDDFVVIDYKTSNTDNVEKTAKHYATQLNCYQKAVQGAYKCANVQKFLYFFLQERLILIDNK